MVDLEVQRKSLPHKPGIYLFKDEKDDVIYVGKAIDLNKRVASYFKKSAYKDPFIEEKIQELKKYIKTIDFIVVQNEKEAFILENVQIKKYSPKYNIRFRDDASYPFLMITYSEKFPRLKIIRGPDKFNQENAFLGPYTDKKELRRILKFMRKSIPFCTCKRKVKENQKRPCMYYQIKLCPGPCVGKISPEDYLQNIKQIELFLRGETKELTALIKEKMKNSSKDLKFEAAAKWRDRLEDISGVTTEHTIISAYEKDQDIIGYYVGKEYAAILALFVREGRITGKRPFLYDLREKILEDKNLIPVFMKQYYLDISVQIPSEIIVDELIDEYDTIKEILSEQGKILVFKKPENHFEEGFLRIANNNAKVLVEQEKVRQDLEQTSPNQIKEALDELEEVLDLPTKPRIIEGFDISNIQGTDPTAGMVHFLEGMPFKKYYRHYKIQLKSTPDDVGMMKEVVHRRYKSLIERGTTLPDLILIDGGKPQLNGAYSILTELNIDNIPIIGLAKRLEEIYVPGRKNPIILPLDSPGLLLLQRVRDEAHRFGLRLHRKLREKRAIKSILDDIPGIGPTRRTNLLKTFGSVEGIKSAKVEDVSKVVGEKLAKVILQKLTYLHKFT